MSSIESDLIKFWGSLLHEISQTFFKSIQSNGIYGNDDFFWENRYLLFTKHWIKANYCLSPFLVVQIFSTQIIYMFIRWFTICICWIWLFCRSDLGHDNHDRWQISGWSSKTITHFTNVHKYCRSQLFVKNKTYIYMKFENMKK